MDAVGKKILDLHGGLIEVDCEGEGRHCTFRFRIPLLPSIDQDAPMPSPPLEESLNNSSPTASAHSPSLLLMSSLGSSTSFSFIPQFRGLRSRSSAVLPLNLQELEGSVEGIEAPTILHDVSISKGDGRAVPIDRYEAEEGPPMTVLVVDDSSLNRKILMRRLRVEGFVCYEADDGDSAVQMIRNSLIQQASTSSSSPSALETPIRYDVVTLDNVSRHHHHPFNEKYPF